ncbi:60S acidic ribosomal protein P0 [Tanacetum coccineum]
MVVKVSKADKKVAYDVKLCQLLDEYSQVLVVAADNVGSNQLQIIRQGLRGDGDSFILMGKNTMMKRSVRIHSEKTGNVAYLNLIPLLVGNVGLIFTKGDLKEVRQLVAKYKVRFSDVFVFVDGVWLSSPWSLVGAPARVGLVAPVDVVVPPGNTGLDPSHTSFFQVLNIPTKINKGTVEIITPVELIKKGDKVGSSEAALLAKLGIRPFSYGLVVNSVYDNGSVFSPAVLDLTEDDLIDKFAMGVSMLTSLALAVHYPTIAAAPYMLINGYKNVLALAVGTGYSFPLADWVKEYLEDPTRFAVAAPGAAASGAASTAAEAAPAEEKNDEPADESDDDQTFSLFGTCVNLLIMLQYFGYLIILGLIFCVMVYGGSIDLSESHLLPSGEEVGAPTRVGLVAPVDVVVFFQVLNIPTKINKGTIETITPIELIKKGDKVGFSEATLLAKHGIWPFSYGRVVNSVYDNGFINKGTIETITPIELIKKGDKVGFSEATLLAKHGIWPFSYGHVVNYVYDNGFVFNPAMLDPTEDDLIDKFVMGVSMLTSLALVVHYPTIAAVGLW